LTIPAIGNLFLDGRRLRRWRTSSVAIIVSARTPPPGMTGRSEFYRRRREIYREVVGFETVGPLGKALVSVWLHVNTVCGIFTVVQNWLVGSCLTTSWICANHRRSSLQITNTYGPMHFLKNLRKSLLY